MRLLASAAPLQGAALTLATWGLTMQQRTLRGDVQVVEATPELLRALVRGSECREVCGGVGT